MGRVHLQVGEAQARERAKGTCVKAQKKGLASLRNKKTKRREEASYWRNIEVFSTLAHKLEP